MARLNSDIKPGDLVCWYEVYYLVIKPEGLSLFKIFNLDTLKFEIIDLHNSNLPLDVIKGFSFDEVPDGLS
jgi:hypothetical protein